MTGEGENVIKKFSPLSALIRYFFHGITFAILTWLLIFALMFIAALLMFIGGIIGLMIGIVLYFFILGGVNAEITHIIWGTKIKMDVVNIAIHGFFLFLALLLIGVPVSVVVIAVLAAGFTFLNIIAWIITFVVSAIIDGFIAKNVAIMFFRDIRESESSETSEIV